MFLLCKDVQKSFSTISSNLLNHVIASAIQRSNLHLNDRHFSLGTTHLIGDRHAPRAGARDDILSPAESQIPGWHQQKNAKRQFTRSQCKWRVALLVNVQEKDSRRKWNDRNAHKQPVVKANVVGLHQRQSFGKESFIIVYCNFAILLYRNKNRFLGDAENHPFDELRMLERIVRMKEESRHKLSNSKGARC